MTAAAGALVSRLPRTTLIVGKGGVGKTTTAAALALQASRTAGRTLVLTTDPARALPTVLDAPVGPEAAPVRWAPGLDARALDAAPLRSRFMERWSGIIRVILDRGTYLDDADIGPLVDTALPGSDEIFAALAIAELLTGKTEGAAHERFVIDTAPTGHTLRLLQLPRTFRALVRLLDAMQGKHRTIVRALTRTYRPDAADAFIAEMDGLVASLEEILRDPSRCAAIVVTQSPRLVQEESRRLLAALHELGIAVAAVIWNATVSIPGALGDAPQLCVPPLDRAPVGRDGLEAWLNGLVPAEVATAAAARSAARVARNEAARADPRALEVLLRPLTVVAGKGGVGKTTVAAALALASSSAARTLVVSTDPAPSLGDALDRPVGDADTPVDGAPGLFARQMDATAAFTRLRDRYRERVDALFDGLVGRGVDLTHDRAIVRDLLALAPPGVDEVYALSLIGDALFADRYDRVVVDPAPTGHLLRLLEMPQLALAWSHQLLRLMLKYREVAGLGEAAEDVLAFARDLRALDAMLRDGTRSGVVLVTLDERVVAGESEWLAAALRERGVAVTGVVRNRSDGAARFRVPVAPLVVDAPVATPPPIGVAALRTWTGAWAFQHADATHER